MEGDSPSIIKGTLKTYSFQMPSKSKEQVCLCNLKGKGSKVEMGRKLGKYPLFTGRNEINSFQPLETTSGSWAKASNFVQTTEKFRTFRYRIPQILKRQDFLLLCINFQYIFNHRNIFEQTLYEIFRLSACMCQEVLKSIYRVNEA